MPRTMTFVEFEQRVLDSLARRRKAMQVPSAERTGRAGKVKPERPRLPAVRHSMRGAFSLLIWVTLPAIAYIVVALLLRLAGRFYRIHRLVSICILLADLAMLLIQPIAALIAGPGFVWYHIANWLYQWGARRWSIGQHQLLHRSLNLVGTDHALFASVNVGGSPLSLYFGVSQAVVSSLFWATLIVFTKELLSRRKRSDDYASGSEEPRTKSY